VQYAVNPLKQKATLSRWFFDRLLGFMHVLRWEMCLTLGWILVLNWTCPLWLALLER